MAMRSLRYASQIDWLDALPEARALLSMGVELHNTIELKKN
ncbi:hypothetical protein SAMN04488118_102116 [Epibacterium ulvae]|uniref:Uncharacterized protein n=1 Tax=Epibacterium ulvae TaxID=1156985 RepID=A0A1G5PVN2_9RHOB|nr:hypothetical protein SAMN04488118_102116 [Epibacterium ulvae]